MSESPADLLRRTTVKVAPETFSIVALTRENWTRLLENAELSPRMTAPFMIFMDQVEVTLVLDEIDLRNMRSGLGDARVEGRFRMLTFDQVLDFSVTGFLAEVSRILSSADVSIIALSSFSRDHLLVRQDDLAAALKALGPYVDELC